MEVSEIKNALEAKFAGLQTELQEAQEKGATKDEVLKLHDSIKTQGEALDAFIESQKNQSIGGVVKQFRSFLQEKKDEIKNIYTKGSGTIEFVPKAPADITTGSGTDIDTVPLTVSTQLGAFNYRNDNDLMSALSVGSTSSPQFSYTEMLPKEGDYAFVQEGAAKPQIDFRWENRYETPKKIAAYEILTEEAVTDYERMTSVARDFLQKRHDLFKVNAVFFADGTGNNPTGATVYGRTFVAGGMAGSIPNGKSNIMDVINACITDIYSTQNFVDEAHYMANVALINPTDFFLNFVAAKDADGLPLYPQASLFNTVTIGGVTIRPWIKIPAGKIFVGDMKVYNVINYVPFSIRIGWINDQFITNKFTMLGESRFFQFVKNLDQNALIYDDIATIQAAIEAV